MILVLSSVWTNVTDLSAEIDEKVETMGKEVNERHYQLVGLRWK